MEIKDIVLKARSPGITTTMIAQKIKEEELKLMFVDREEKEKLMPTGIALGPIRQFKSKEVLGKENAIKRRMARTIKRINNKAKMQAKRKASKLVYSKEV